MRNQNFCHPAAVPCRLEVLFLDRGRVVLNKKVNLTNAKVRDLFVLLLLFIGTPFFFLGGNGYHSARFAALWNLGHVFFFALTSWLLCSAFGKSLPKLPGFIIQLMVFFTALVLGLVVEGLQMGIDGRTPDAYDILRNQLGCLIALASSCPGRTGKGKWKPLYRGVVVLLVVLALYPLGRVITGDVFALGNFPVLADFETACEIDRWQTKKRLVIQEDIVRHGRYALKGRFTTDTYSWVSLAHSPENWEGFSNLFFSVYLPEEEEEELSLICHIQDSESDNRYKDLFKRRVTLEKGWNDVMIPLADVKEGPDDRQLNMQQIVSLTFVVVRQKKERTFYIDSVYLGK